MRSSRVVSGLAGLVAEATEAVDRLVSGVGSGALGGCSHAELGEQLAQVRALQARLEWVALGVVREVDVRGSFADEGMLSAAAWVRAHGRLAPRQAAGMVRTARALGSGPLADTSTALARGEVHAGHVRVIASGVAGAPAGAVGLIEPEALAVARESDPRSVASVMRRFRATVDPDGAEEAAVRRYERRGLTLAPTFDGSFAIGGLADEVNGALVTTAVDAASPLVPGDRRTPAQRRLDALADICRAYLASPKAPTVGGARPQLILTLHQPAPVAAPSERESAGDRSRVRSGPVSWRDASLSWAGPVGESTAARVGCDAAVTLVEVDAGGEVVRAGRTRRFFTWAQRKAMIARDGDRCVVPYCDAPVMWADGHHLQHWTEGGPTTVANGALPCAAHHVRLHEGRWWLERLRDGRYVMRHPDGRVIGPEPHPPGGHRPRPHPRL